MRQNGERWGKFATRLQTETTCHPLSQIVGFRLLLSRISQNKTKLILAIQCLSRAPIIMRLQKKGSHKRGTSFIRLSAHMGFLCALKMKQNLYFKGILQYFDPKCKLLTPDICTMQCRQPHSKHKQIRQLRGRRKRQSAFILFQK